ncbi:MAG: hypothetical protein JOY54_04530 [Acidobacteriaceae bacterium]|nr:hypothetical protein [Acidobacteriaceae bacterium]
MKRDFILWIALLGGPIVWLISFETNFALAPWACIFQTKLALHVISIVALVLAAVSGLLAWQEWKGLSGEKEDRPGGSLPRSRSMALGGVLMSAMFFLVILAQSIPAIVLSACE